MTVLLREAIGDRLRHARTTQQRTLREVSRTARVSLGYLSEVERGRKEASSELLASICDALELPLSELLNHVAADMRSVESVGTPGALTETVPAERLVARAGGRVEGGRLVPAVLGEELADLRIQPVLTHRLSTPIGTSITSTALGKPRAGVVVAA